MSYTEIQFKVGDKVRRTKEALDKNIGSWSSRCNEYGVSYTEEVTVIQIFGVNYTVSSLTKPDFKYVGSAEYFELTQQKIYYEVY